jgi:hypothetical protein
MAKDKDDKGRPIFSRGPRQASRIFGLDQEHWDGTATGAGAPSKGTTAPPRPKFLFLVRFVRGVGSGGVKWQDGITFAVRRIDRPSISPQMQVMNQYNKKRLVQTGFKYEPVNIEFHDTLDAVLNSMWQEYSSWYFGDFRVSNQNSWRYDVTMPDFKNSGPGFGFTLPPGPTTGPSVLESSQFFERVECYQLYGRNFTRFDLVNPKIAKYDPDDMSYDAVTESHGIRMTLEYEAMVNHNNGNTLAIDSSEELAALFGQQLDGDVYDPPRQVTPNILNQNIPFYGNITRVLTKIPTTQYGIFGKAGKLLSDAQQVAQIPGAIGGVLNSFGKVQFTSGGRSTSQVGTISAKANNTDDPNNNA